MLKTVLWGSLGLLVYTHAGYPLVLWALARGRSDAPSARAGTTAGEEATLPTVSMVVAAHDEEQVIAGKVENALALDYPSERLEVVVLSLIHI